MVPCKIREPVVAGQFYPASAGQLKNQIEGFLDKKVAQKNVITCMLPHAGYTYSGRVAAQTVSSLIVKEKVILLGPNHTGLGRPYSIMTQGVWRTPLGEISIDNYLAGKILAGSKYLQEDALAHLNEHSLEVELPILQYFKKDFQIVPIVLMSSDINALKEIGAEIASVLKEPGSKEKTLVVASSDMTHYEAQEEAVKKDRQAIEAILRLDPDELIEKISRYNISMCGYAPVVVMLTLAKLLGAKAGQLIKYETSGDITGDKESVVGYAGITIY